jgi:DNA-binding SARP family transcriptional activator
MARLSICLLGSFEVRLDGKVLTSFESDKVRALLAYLAVEVGHSQPREKLASLLWPERPEQAARSNLAHALTVLRQAIIICCLLSHCIAVDFWKVFLCQVALALRSGCCLSKSTCTGKR